MDGVNYFHTVFHTPTSNGNEKNDLSKPVVVSIRERDVQIKSRAAKSGQERRHGDIDRRL